MSPDKSNGSLKVTSQSVSADDFEWDTKAALTGGTMMVVALYPNPSRSMLAA
jgi:hypothetical protein